jgi:nucleotide-binding universal stress UspA family protein
MAIAADWNAGSFRPVPGGPILLALEKNEAMQAAVETARSLAEVFQRTLIVLHARSAAEVVGFLNPYATTLAEFGIAEDGAVPARCIVKDGRPADAIAGAIEQYQPSVLVMGVKRASETPGPHGTAFSLLARSRVPILCVPPDTASDIAHEETRLATGVACPTGA